MGGNCNGDGCCRRRRVRSPRHRVGRARHGSGVQKACFGAANRRGLAVVALIVTVYFGVGLALMNLLDDATATTLVTFLIGPLTGLAVYAVTSVGPAVAYAGLRQASEGAVGDIATVFD